MTGIWPDGPFTVLTATLLVSLALLVLALAAAVILALAWLLSWPVAALFDREGEPHPFTATRTDVHRARGVRRRWYRW